MAVYRQCLSCKSVIAFSEGRRYVEKLAYYVNLLGGDGFARVHHGSLSKEQRDEVERDLREGRLRLLCATSSMELGIDVGDVEQVLQVGCPRTISSTMQRLGRAGHNPGRVSVMYMYPRTAPESVYCGMTAQVARRGGVERANPPRMCLDVLAQHLVSMASGESYSIDDVMDVLDIQFPEEDSDTYDTLNGYLISRLDRIPQEGENPRVGFGGYTFEVIKAGNKMIESIHVFQDQEEEGDGGKDREGLGTVQGKDSNSPQSDKSKKGLVEGNDDRNHSCLLYTSPSPRD